MRSCYSREYFSFRHPFEKHSHKHKKTKFVKYCKEGDKINPLLYVVVVLDQQKKLRFLKFSFFEIYEIEVGKVMVDKMKDLLINLFNLFNFYSSIHSPNVQESSRSERT